MTPAHSTNSTHRGGIHMKEYGRVQPKTLAESKHESIVKQKVNDCNTNSVGYCLATSSAEIQIQVTCSTPDPAVTWPMTLPPTVPGDEGRLGTYNAIVINPIKEGLHVSKWY